MNTLSLTPKSLTSEIILAVEKWNRYEALMAQIDVFFEQHDLFKMTLIARILRERFEATGIESMESLVERLLSEEKESLKEPQDD